MAKNTDIKGLLDDGVDNNGIDNTPETDEIKYKEIKMPSDSLRDGSGHINLASPINFDIPRVNPSDGNYRHNNSVFDDENLADRDIVPCPTCRGTGTIHAGIFGSLIYALIICFQLSWSKVIKYAKFKFYCILNMLDNSNMIPLQKNSTK